MRCRLSPRRKKKKVRDNPISGATPEHGYHLKKYDYILLTRSLKNAGY